MNNKGIGFFYTLMLGVTIIILGLALNTPIKQFVDSARNETTLLGSDGMNCTNPEITNFDDATCTALDMIKFLGGGILILIGIVVIGAKIIWQ